MPLHFPYAEPPQSGTFTALGHGVYWIRHTLPFALNHINVWAIAPAQEHEGWTLIDTGIGTPATQDHWHNLWHNPAWNTISRGQPLGRIIVTHFHPDHMGLAKWIGDMHGAPLLMSLSDYLYGHAVYYQQGAFRIEHELSFFKKHGLTPVQESTLRSRQKYYHDSLVGYPEHFQRLHDGEILSIGGELWQCISGDGHSPEHIGLYNKARKILISGDLLLPKITTNVRVGADMPTANSVAWYVHSLRKWQRVIHPDTLVLPSHGLPFLGAHERIAQLIAHHEERLDKTQSLCREQIAITPNGILAADLVHKLFPQKLDDHQLFFAFGETIAHLNELVGKGLMTMHQSTERIAYKLIH